MGSHSRLCCESVMANFTRDNLYLFKDKTQFVGFSTLVFSSIKQFEIKSQCYGFQGSGLIVQHNCKHWVINKYLSGNRTMTVYQEVTG